MITVNEIILPTANAAVSQTSPGLFIENMFGFSVQAVFTGSPNGSASLQGCDDAGIINVALPPIGQGVVNWNEIKDSPQMITGAMIVTWNYQGAFFRWVRFVYTASSGSGNVTVTINAKGV